MSEPHEASEPTDLYREYQMQQGTIEQLRAEIAEWRATQQSLLRSEGKRWATIRELRAQNDQLRELIQRTENKS